MSMREEHYSDLDTKQRPSFPQASLHAKNRDHRVFTERGRQRETYTNREEPRDGQRDGDRDNKIRITRRRRSRCVK